MSTGTPDTDLGLAQLDPVQPPAELWDNAVSVAIDPSTAPPEEELIPDPDSFVEDGSADEAGTEDIDLSEFDDSADSTDSAEDADVDAGDVTDLEPTGVDSTSIGSEASPPLDGEMDFDTGLDTSDLDTSGTQLDPNAYDEGTVDVDALHSGDVADDLDLGTFDGADGL